MVIQETDYLAHYGVKGMRWGVRKEYEPKGRKKGSSTTVTSEKKQLTPEEKKARNKAIAKKVAIGAAAVGATLAVVGGSVWLYNKMHHQGGFASMDRRVASSDGIDMKLYPDKGFTFSAGQKFRRMSSVPTEDLIKKGKTYVSFLKKDNRIYKEALPDIFKKRAANYDFPYEGSFVHTLTAKTDLKIASPRKMAETYSAMMAEKGQRAYGPRFEDFIANMMEEDRPGVKEFISRMKAQGFNGVVDLNDWGWTEAPLIIFDPASNLEATSSRKLGAIERVINTLMLPNNPITDMREWIRETMKV